MTTKPISVRIRWQKMKEAIMGQISTDQSHQVLATLAVNTDWEAIDFKGSGLQDLVVRDPQEAGRQFTAFLKNGGKVFVGESKIITIDRTKPFDPAFVGEGWTVLEDETDTRSTSLTELNLTKVCFESMLGLGEMRISGEEKLKRLKASGHIRLDAKVFQTLWENHFLLPEAWKDKVDGNIHYISFYGTPLQNLDGDRYVLCLYWGGGEWDWGAILLDDDWRDHVSSAVLVS